MTTRTRKTKSGDGGKEDDGNGNAKKRTVAELKSELSKRELPTDGVKDVLLSRLEKALREEEVKEEEKRSRTTTKSRKRPRKEDEDKEGGEDDDCDDDDVAAGGGATTTTTTTTRRRRTKEDDNKDDENENEKKKSNNNNNEMSTTRKQPPPAKTSALRRGRSRSKSAEPSPPPPPQDAVEKKRGAGKEEKEEVIKLETIEEEGEEKKNSSAAAAMRGKMQKAKELMKKQKALAEKMKMKKMEAAGGASLLPPPPSLPPPPPPPPVAATAQPLISAQRAIDKARETAARLAALQHQQKKNTKTSTEAKFEKTGPAPVLRVNEKGQEVDENGKIIVRAKDYTATTKWRWKRCDDEAIQPPAGKKDEVTKEDMIDPEIAVKQKHNRKKPSLQFVAKGTYEKQADFARLVNKFGEVDAIKIRAREDREKKRAAHTEALEAAVAGEVKIDIGEAIVHDRPVDGVEWWDKPFLKDGKTYADVPLDDRVLEDDKVGALWERVLNTDKITKYVEHPYLDDPPMEAPPPPPPAVKLTKKEQKKLRHQRRVAREQEKQEMIRQGVLEPPKPKVKISNMMRVLTEEAVLDPTMIEKKVKEEMEERQQAHDDRNLSRKLTPAERREKKIRKLLRDNTSEAGEVFTHVYRVENMRNVKNKFKIDVNAQENHLTGIGIITDTFTIVIVEGTNKGLKRYEKLMMRRMDWKLTNEDYTDEEIDRAENNKCTLVWKGSGPQRKMKRFHFETLRTEAAARKYLETDFNCANYFDAAQSAVSVDDDEDEDEDKGEDNGGGDAMEIS
ncbi:unnamed protein product [Bathycoccus prasinos]